MDRTATANATVRAVTRMCESGVSRIFKEQNQSQQRFLSQDEGREGLHMSSDSPWHLVSRFLAICGKRDPTTPTHESVLPSHSPKRGYSQYRNAEIQPTICAFVSHTSFTLPAGALRARYHATPPMAATIAAPPT